MNYYISDLHLFHNKILTLQNTNRSFTSIEEMHEKIKREWNKKVTYQDKVYILLLISNTVSQGRNSLLQEIMIYSMFETKNSVRLLNGSVLMQKSGITEEKLFCFTILSKNGMDFSAMLIMYTDMSMRKQSNRFLAGIMPVAMLMILHRRVLMN